mmetsp:Transcript_20238/g.48294  ORF Transcript_20238/g.48294 Transcript_20238/m.48294 type:complete len:360 (+) Transcript_20238:170-1249(+)
MCGGGARARGAVLVQQRAQQLPEGPRAPTPPADSRPCVLRHQKARLRRLRLRLCRVALRPSRRPWPRRHHDKSLADDLVSDLIAPLHRVADDSLLVLGAFDLLDGVVEGRVEVHAERLDGFDFELGEHLQQLLVHRLVAVVDARLSLCLCLDRLSSPLEVIQHHQQLLHHRCSGRLRRTPQVPCRALAEVVEVSCQTQIRVLEFDRTRFCEDALSLELLQRRQLCLQRGHLGGGLGEFLLQNLHLPLLKLRRHPVTLLHRILPARRGRVNAFRGASRLPFLGLVLLSHLEARAESVTQRICWKDVRLRNAKGRDCRHSMALHTQLKRNSRAEGERQGAGCEEKEGEKPSHRVCAHAVSL